MQGHIDLFRIRCSTARVRAMVRAIVRTRVAIMH